MDEQDKDIKSLGPSSATGSPTWVRRYVALLLGLILGLALVSIFLVEPSSIGNPPILIFVFLSAILGSATNLSLGELEVRLLNTRSEQLYYLAWKMLVAIVFALFLYVAFMAKIVEGPLFPVFQNTGEDVTGSYESVRKLMDICKPSRNIDAAKMFVWAFVAGYVERFVPNLIATTSQAGQSQAP